VILSLWPFEKVKLDKAWHLVEMSVARQPDLLESCLAAFDDFEAVHCNEHPMSPDELAKRGPELRQ
jgi:hypothetical protein